ncbi:unnamed protein product [Moneuplotes crassus]|uniref:Uncharacterized protein n=1 Tax=Euplotes crassus TaxID=5936 RepID=A0AAD1X680_EUPCR|nr:unnamed protein product [Moneuplotes crassus]
MESVQSCFSVKAIEVSSFECAQTKLNFSYTTIFGVEDIEALSLSNFAKYSSACSVMSSLTRISVD